MIKSPGFFVRLMVIVYDGLLLAGTVFAAHMLLFILVKLLPNTIETSYIVKALHFALLIGVSFFFYGWFWVNGGQTLGMKTWKLYLIHEDTGKFISWKTAFKRYVAALISWLCIGMGFMWILIHKQNKTWHDIFTKTQIVKVKQP